jgi:D-glucosaminate-6-phosphate ammonia-lyase
MSPSTSTRASTPAPTFASIGVRTLINGRGTYTIISGSRALPQVAEAMREATNHYVQMEELMERVGERLAQVTGAPWGYVASGCAAALTEITAACIAGADPEKMARLPDTTGMRDEVVIQRAHRNSYDRAILAAGARMIEVETLADLRAAVGERTAMVAITGDQAHLGRVTVQQTIDVARERGVPSLVDAAAERPDVPNRYLAMGADAVAYSGGKCLRGPQASGLVLGRKDLLQAACLNSAPHHSLGRTMKAGKEEVMGLLAAVEAWVLGRDHGAEWRMWEEYLECIASAVRPLPSVATSIREPGIANVAPNLVVTWDPATLECAPSQVHAALWGGEPRIAVHLIEGGLLVNPYMLEAGDAEIIARRLGELLGGRLGLPPQRAPIAPDCDVSGEWELRTRYVLGESRHGLALEQSGGALAGTCRSCYEGAAVTGSVAGKDIEFRVNLGYQAIRTEYVFRGTVDGDTMGGTVTLGEYGQAEWSARRCAAPA